MLGKCPRSFLHRTTSKGDQLHSHEIVHLEDEKPVLQPPHQIVIGFDLGATSSRSLLTQACESPRSVLEPLHLCFRTHHQQSRSPRSPLSAPLSALGSLLSGHSRSGPYTEGAALCLKVAIKAEEGAVGTNACHSFSRRGHVACDVDGTDAYDASREAYNASLKRVCDDRNNANMKSKPVRTDYLVVRHNQPWKHGPSERARVRKNQPWNHGPSERACCGSRANPHSKRLLSRDCEDEDSDDEDVDNQVSIFSTASPVSDHSRHESPAVDFLSKCFLCRRHLLQGKDIYMYRGDRAFCSQECRHQQIVVDERKERYPAAVACVSGASTHHHRVRRATEAAVA